MVVTDKLIEHFPDVVDVNFTAHMEKELDDIAEGEIGKVQMLHEFNGPFERALEKAEDSFERYEEELDELCPLCPTEGREPGKLQVKLGRFGKFIGCPNYPECRYIRNMDGTERAEPEMLDETVPRVRATAAAPRRPLRPVRRVQRVPRVPLHQEGSAPYRSSITCPQCNQGEIVEKRTRFGVVLRMRSVPGMRLRGEQPADQGAACPEDGSLLLQRPKSIRCWGCGAEFDLDIQPHQARRSRGGGRGTGGEVRGPRRARGREGGEEDDLEEEARREEEDDHHAEEDDDAEARREEAGHDGRSLRGRRVSSSITDEVAELRGTRSATIKDLLTNRGFSRLLAAMVVSSFGDWLGFIAVTSIVAGIGGVGSAGVAVAGVMVARTLPAFVFGPIAGAFVDRLDRKQLMIASDIGRGVLYLSMAFLHQLWAIYLFSFVIECLSLLWTPARDASLPNLVPRRQLANANSLVVISSYATLPIGGIAFAALAGVSTGLGARVPVLGDSPAALALVVDAATFLFSAAMVFGIPLRTLRGDSTEKMDLSRVFRDARDGIRFLREDSIASAMTGGLVIAFAGIGAVLAIMPIFVQYTLRGRSSGWGLVVTAFGVGLAFGTRGGRTGGSPDRARPRRGLVVVRGRDHVDPVGRDAEPRVGGRLVGMARRVLRARLRERLHALAGERRR